MEINLQSNCNIIRKFLRSIPVFNQTQESIFCFLEFYNIYIFRTLSCSEQPWYPHSDVSNITIKTTLGVTIIIKIKIMKNQPPLINYYKKLIVTSMSHKTMVIKCIIPWQYEEHWIVIPAEWMKLLMSGFIIKSIWYL